MNSNNLEDFKSKKILNPMKEVLLERLNEFNIEDQNKIVRFANTKFKSILDFWKKAEKILLKTWIFNEEDIWDYIDILNKEKIEKQEKLHTITNNQVEKIDEELLEKEITWWLFDVSWLVEEHNIFEEYWEPTSVFWINKLYSFKVSNDNKNEYITNKEYEDLKNTYSIFAKSYQVNKNWNYYEKTIKILLEEMIVCANLFNLDKEEFFKDCWIDLNKITDKWIRSKVNATPLRRVKHYNFHQFLVREISDLKSDKFKTEIVMKILIYKNDMWSFATVLYNKMYWMIQNTNLKLLVSEKFNQSDFENLFVFEIIKWIKWYREKLFNWHWHKTKVMSYVDRILRNLAWTMNQKIVYNQELFWLYAQQWDWEEWDQIVDYLWWVDEINEDEIYFDFSKWWYLIKYIDQDSSDLLNNFIKWFHYFKNETYNVSLILNLQWYYFFEKILKNYDLHWKIINSYFDLIILLKKYWKISYEKVVELLINEDTLKFWVLWMNWENYNKLIIYEFSCISIYDLMKEKCTKEEVDKYLKEYKKSLKVLIDIVYTWKDKNIKDNISYMKLLWDTYKLIRSFEKLFIDNIYEKILEKHNLWIIWKLINAKFDVFKSMYKEEYEYALKIHNIIKEIKQLHKSKYWKHNDLMYLLKRNKKWQLKQKFRWYIEDIRLLWKKETYLNFEKYKEEIINKLQYFRTITNEIIEEKNDYWINIEDINMLFNNN